MYTDFNLKKLDLIKASSQGSELTVTNGLFTSKIPRQYIVEKKNIQNNTEKIEKVVQHAVYAHVSRVEGHRNMECDIASKDGSTARYISTVRLNFCKEERYAFFVMISVR